MLVKICGVKDPETAAFAAQCGADFIGCILTAGFRRSVDASTALSIARAARAAGAQPVGVFVSASQEEIELTCQQLGIDCVQAYNGPAILPPHLSRFYVNSPEAELRADCDFLLMESADPGSGKSIDFDTFTPPQNKPWILAGGLTPENVEGLIQRYRPSGVDVSSGVEVEGKKDFNRIRAFIEKVQEYD